MNLWSEALAIQFLSIGKPMIFSLSMFAFQVLSRLIKTVKLFSHIWISKIYLYICFYR